METLITSRAAESRIAAVAEAMADGELDLL